MNTAEKLHPLNQGHAVALQHRIRVARWAHARTQRNLPAQLLLDRAEPTEAPMSNADKVFMWYKNNKK